MPTRLKRNLQPAVPTCLLQSPQTIDIFHAATNPASYLFKIVVYNLVRLRDAQTKLSMNPDNELFNTHNASERDEFSMITQSDNSGIYDSRFCCWAFIAKHDGWRPACTHCWCLLVLKVNTALQQFTTTDCLYCTTIKWHSRIKSQGISIQATQHEQCLAQ